MATKKRTLASNREGTGAGKEAGKEVANIASLELLTLIFPASAVIHHFRAIARDIARLLLELLPDK
jgi:hypothetical protein